MLALAGTGSSDNSSQLVFASAATVATLSACYLLKKSLEPKPKLPYPPGPGDNHWFGGLFDFPDFEKGETMDTRNLKNAIEYGKVYSVNLPFVVGRLIIVTEPELAKKIMVTKNYPKSFFYQQLSPLLGEQSLASIIDDKKWAGMRRAFNPGFSHDFLKNVVTTMAQKLERFIETIEEDIQHNNVTDMLAGSQAFTSDVIVTVAFGEDWGSTKHPARALEDEICKLFSSLMKSPMRRIFDFRTKQKMNQVGVELDKVMHEILDRRLATAGGNDIRKSKDICSLAISHLMQEDGSLTENDKAVVVDQLKTFYFAGHDTTATTIAWVMWSLSQHPEVLEKLRSELQEHRIWTDLQSIPTYDELQKCKYLDAVIKEALRLYPPASGLSRYNPDMNDTYNGYAIGGAIVLVNVYAMHRHPDLWKQPNEFLPDRFLDGSESDIQSKFIPFSRGPRDCIGKYFALLEARLAVSALVTRYDLKCDNPNDTLHYNLTNVPKYGAKVKFSIRKQN